MNKNILQFIIDANGNYLRVPSGSVKANSNLTTRIQVLTPIDAGAQVNYVIYDSKNINEKQYMVKRGILAKDCLKTSDELYLEVSGWYVYEIDIYSPILSVISRYKTGKVGISFAFVQNRPDSRAKRFIDYFGEFKPLRNDTLLPQASDGDYWICDTYNYLYPFRQTLYNKGDIVIWYNNKYNDGNSETKALTSTVDISVDPAITYSDTLNKTDVGNIIAELTDDMSHFERELNQSNTAINMLFDYYYTLGYTKLNVFTLGEDTDFVYEKDGFKTKNSFFNNVDLNFKDTIVNGTLLVFLKDIDENNKIQNEYLFGFDGAIYTRFIKFENDIVTDIEPLRLLTGAEKEILDKLVLDIGDVTLLTTTSKVVVGAINETNTLAKVAQMQALHATDKADEAYQLAEDNYDNIQNLENTVNSLTNDKLDKKPNGEDNLIDANDKINLVYLSDTSLGNVQYMGLWDALTNTPTLPNTPKKSGQYWICDVAGTFNGLDFKVGDWIIANGLTWGRVANSDAVTSVAGKTGNVVLNKNDVGLNLVDNTADIDKPISTAVSEKFNTITSNDDKIHNSNGGFAGGMSSTTEQGGAIGFEAETSSGGAVGANTISLLGGAVGDTAQTASGGAVGHLAKSTFGGAVGNYANTTFGGAIGYEANTGYGGAVGQTAQSTTGGAIGQQSQTASGGAVGYLAESDSGFAGGVQAQAISGGAIGVRAIAGTGGAIGHDATVTQNGAGGAVGFKAKSTFGGGAVGDTAQTVAGGAIGLNAKSASGLAGGGTAETTLGLAGGANTKSTFGSASGWKAETTTGGAVGSETISGSGFAGGENAKTSPDINAIQLGTGLNTEENTLKVYDYTLLDANGKIPNERLNTLGSGLDIVDVNNLPADIIYTPNGRKTPQKRYMNFYDPLRSNKVTTGNFVDIGNNIDYQDDFESIINNATENTGLYRFRNLDNNIKINSILELEEIYTSQGYNIHNNRYIYEFTEDNVFRYDISGYTMMYAQKAEYVIVGEKWDGMAGQLDVYEDSSGRYFEQLTTYQGNTFKRWLDKGMVAENVFESTQWLMVSENTSTRRYENEDLELGNVLQIVDVKHIPTPFGTYKEYQTAFAPTASSSNSVNIIDCNIDYVDIDGYKTPNTLYINFDNSSYEPVEISNKDYINDTNIYQNINDAIMNKEAYISFGNDGIYFVGEELVYDISELSNHNTFYIIQGGHSNQLYSYSDFNIDELNQEYTGNETIMEMQPDGNGKKGTLFVTHFIDNTNDLQIEELTTFEVGAVKKYTRFYNNNDKTMSAWV